MAVNCGGKGREWQLARGHRICLSLFWFPSPRMAVLRHFLIPLSRLIAKSVGKKNGGNRLFHSAIGRHWGAGAPAVFDTAQGLGRHWAIESW